MARANRSKKEAGTPRLAGLAVFVGVALVSGWLGSIPVSSALEAWYPGLAKPAFAPPHAVLPIVWPALCVIMGTAAWLAWIAPGSVARNTVLVLYFVQLALGASWSWTFFGFHRIGLALVVMLALDAAAAWMTLAARRVSAASVILLAPYLAGIAFATVLGAALYLMNRT